MDYGIGIHKETAKKVKKVEDGNLAMLQRSEHELVAATKSTLQAKAKATATAKDPGMTIDGCDFVQGFKYCSGTCVPFMQPC